MVAQTLHHLEVIDISKDSARHALAVDKLPPVMERRTGLPHVICQAVSRFKTTGYLTEHLHCAAIDKMSLQYRCLSEVSTNNAACRVYVRSKLALSSRLEICLYEVLVDEQTPRVRRCISRGHLNCMGDLGVGGEGVSPFQQQAGNTKLAEQGRECQASRTSSGNDDWPLA